MKTNEIGLFGKFHVSRVDGRDKPGGSKENARYFVLDYVNDPYAYDVLAYYAMLCRSEYPKLAQDLMKELSNV